MNTFAKYCPNVFLVKCDTEHQKGETVIVETKYGKEVECILHKLIIRGKDGFFYYSYIREDGKNSQKRAAAKADKYCAWSDSAGGKAQQYFILSNEGRDFLSLGEPIKIGHHSEHRHRSLLERNWNRMGKCVEFSQKAESHESKAEYWSKMASKIDLSMPESLEYFAYKLKELEDRHAKIKSGIIPSEHSYSLQYARKDVVETKKKLEIAAKLWA